MAIVTQDPQAVRRAAVGPVESHGILGLTGADRVDYLHRMATQDLKSLAAGEGRYTAFLNQKGHLVGEGTVLGRAQDVLVDVAEPSLDAVKELLEKFIIMDDVGVEDLSAKLRVLPLLGSEAAALADRLAPHAPRAAGRRGIEALDLWLAASEAEAIRTAAIASGAVALDEGDLEALRIAAGLPRYGLDMDLDRLPMEAGLTRTAINFHKGCYLGQEVVVRATSRGKLQKGLVQLALPPGAGPGTTLSFAGAEVGVVTSAAETWEGRLGLGYLKAAHWNVGEKLATPAGEATVRRILAAD
jgi:folate-binding protein YgfZ